MNEEKAFDAGESYLCEADQEPSVGWRTVSLVTGILRLIEQRPETGGAAAETRRETIKAAAAELTARGLDAVALVRYGMSQEVAAPIVSALLVKLMGGDSAIEGVDAQAWCAALGIDQPASPGNEPSLPEIVDRFTEVIRPAISGIAQWVGSASLDEIIFLTPPQPGDLATTVAAPSGERALHEQYQWVVDHFAQTFYRDWRTSSLHNELRWLDGDIVPPCTDNLMHDRLVPREELVEEIARRAVYRTGIPDIGDSVSAEMTRHAIALLHQGKHSEAVAVFEFGVTQRPDDPEIRNNLGFCMIPVDPNAALEQLKTAANMGYASSVTNAYNQMCCYWALGRSRAALNIAAAEWSKVGPGLRSSLLWRLTARDEWELYDADDPSLAMAAFAAEIARREGWQEQDDLWRANKDSRTDQSSGAP